MVITSAIFGIPVRITFARDDTIVGEILPDMPVMDRPFDLRSTYHIARRGGAVETLYRVLEATVSDFQFDTHCIVEDRSGC